jgi:hypothetical protein
MIIYEKTLLKVIKVADMMKVEVNIIEEKEAWMSRQEVILEPEDIILAQEDISIITIIIQETQKEDQEVEVESHQAMMMNLFIIRAVASLIEKEKEA